MDLIITVFIAAIIGAIAYYLTTLPMEPIVKTAIRVGTVVVILLWFIARLGFVIPNVMH